MRCMTVLLVLTCASLSQAPLASANTLRCGSALIEPGDDVGYVLEKCGAPDSRDGPELVSGAAIYYPAAVVRADRWRYERGPGKFPAVLTIGDDGRVAAIQFEKKRE